MQQKVDALSTSFEGAQASATKFEAEARAAQAALQTTTAQLEELRATSASQAQQLMAFESRVGELVRVRRENEEVCVCGEGRAKRNVGGARRRGRWGTSDVVLQATHLLDGLVPGRQLTRKCEEAVAARDELREIAEQLLRQVESTNKPAPA